LRAEQSESQQELEFLRSKLEMIEEENIYLKAILN